MPKPDAAHRATDDELARLERRIARLYREAADELQETIETYFEKFKKRDEEMKALIGTVQNGKEWTEQDYKLWRLNQIGRGRRYEALREKIAQRMTNAHETAIAYVNDATPGIYSLNRNYAAYTIERVAGNVDFTLWDEQTVRRLIVEQPDLMPYYPKAAAVKRGIDLEYGKKQITKCVTSSILQGKSIKGISDDLQRYIPTMSRDSAIRAARTAVTGAQNAGRMDSYAAAAERGISLKREWVATLDNRTRHAHAMLDGTKVGMNEPFKVDGYKIMFPGDRGAPGYLIYNCRCTMVAAVDGIDTSDAIRRTKDGIVSDMTYAQWEASKYGYDGKQLSPYHKTNAASIAANAKDDADTLKFFGADARDDLQSIVKRRTMKLGNGFACFPDGDALGEYVQNVKPLKTYFDVAMHGAQDAVGFGTTETNMSPRLLASVIRHSDGWNGQKIRLLSCSTGKQSGDAYCFAEELANALGVEVKAPNDTLYIYKSGRMHVGNQGAGKFVSFMPNQRRRKK